MPLFSLLGLVLVYYLHNRIPQINIPTPAVPKNNAYDDFVRAGNLALTHKNISPYWVLQPNQLETMANFEPYARVAEPILPIVQKALNKPCLTPPQRSDKDYQSHSNDNGALREVTRLIGALARYHEMRKELYKAASICLDGYEMWAHLSHGSNELGAMTDFACEELLSYRFAPLISKLSSSELIAIGQRMDKIEEQRVQFADIVIEEGRSTTANSIEKLKDPESLGSFSAVSENIRFKEELKGSKDIGDFMNMAIQKTKPTPTWAHKWAAVKFTMADKYQMVQDNMDYYNALATEIRKPYASQLPVPLPTNLMIFPMTVNIQARFLTTTVLNRLFRTIAALRVYKFQNKHYPASLANLIPRYMPSLPIDPFAGPAPTPLRYKLLNNRTDFLLYSIGPDMKDDQGSPVQYITSQDSGDLVAGHLWPKRKGPQ
jgi:hypothetical protein